MGKDESDMNRALEQWAEESDFKAPEESVVEIKTTSEPIQPGEKCIICGKETAKEVCSNCGKHVCKSCYFELLGLCEYCLPVEQVKEWKTPRNAQNILDIDWIE